MTLSNNQSHPFVFPFDPTPVTQNLPSTFDLSQDSTICARNHTAGNFCDPKQKRDIFPTDIRPLIPERNLQAMKMLIYSQKDIIYEESENEVSELTSHRTKNHTRNVSNAFSAAESSN